MDTPTTSPENLADKPQVPQKFLDPKTGEIRVDVLLRSYQELERKLAAMVPAPNHDDPESIERFRQALGIPNTPEEYQVIADHGLFEPDADVNRTLHAVGLTPDQVQSVYDLAAEKFVPMIVEMASELQADREMERLVQHFGGKEKWREISRQIFAWGKKSLQPDVLDALSSSFDGIIAMYQMMQKADKTPAGKVENSAPLNEKDVQAMMRDPKYWRDKNPDYINKVTSAFENIYKS